MPLRFGTDGVRGVANLDLTPELVVALGRAAARVFDSPELIVGRDTRVSSPLLEAALAAGASSEGVTVAHLGVAPTPAVAFLSADRGRPGAVISASHNPYPDNGIKFFLPGGRKLSDEVEDALEAELDRIVRDGPGTAVPTGADVGVVGQTITLDAYVEHLLASVEGRQLDGLRVVIDCANGAAVDLAPRALTTLGADVTVIHAEPDGMNINDRCGSTHPEDLQRTVVAENAAVGLAFDGDADRVLAVDATGALVDGDQIIAVCALDLRERQRLRGESVVVTAMTNLGFRRAMADAGIDVIETGVGDRHVLEALQRGGWSLGGEQSGHVIFRDLATTGDGLLTGIQLLDVMVRRRTSLAELARVVTRCPQVMRNVRVPQRASEAVEGAAAAIAAAEAELGETGRVLVRASGTEPVVRVMVEAPTAERAAEVAERLVEAVLSVAPSASG